jgi:concentrative nucleoside transporter, CNT family
MDRYISLLGLVVMLFLAWLMSAHKTKVSWRIVFGGLALQMVFAFLVIKTAPGRMFFDSVGNVFNTLLNYVDAGAEFVFDKPYKEHYFAFRVLPTIIFFSSLMSMLYYLGVMQFIVKNVAIVMQKTLGTSGAESLSAAANIFVGQTEAPLVIKPYVAKMTKSELMAVMVGGFATIAGGVMAAFIGMGINASDLLTASVLSAPAALVIAKIMQPEVEEPVTKGTVKLDVEKNGDNLIHAAANGAADGVKLAINVAGMLIAFMAIIAMCDGLIGWIGTLINPDYRWSLSAGLGYLFYPFARLMGMPEADCSRMGELLGIRLIASEFNAYSTLSEWIKPGGIELTERSQALVTYALCGFSTFASIGIQIGGIGPLAPERTGDLARLGLRAMLGGNLASFCTACVAGLLLTEGDLRDRIIRQETDVYAKQVDTLKSEIGKFTVDSPDKLPKTLEEATAKITETADAISKKEKRLARDLGDESKKEITDNRTKQRAEFISSATKLYEDAIKKTQEKPTDPNKK